MEYPHANANGPEAPQALAGDKSISATRIDNGFPQEENIVAAKSNHLPNVNRNPEHESTNGNLKTTALSEVNPNTVTSVNGASSKQGVSNQTDTQPTVTPKKVTIVDVGEEDAGGDPSLERVLPDGEDQDDGPEDDQNANPQMGIGTKKKKKRKPKSKRGLNTPTGFEEYYVDAPLTPAEYEEEKSMYDSSFPFAQRIEKAVQRYVAKRNLDSERKKLFDRYLVNGGVEAGPKMFSGGLDNDALGTMNAAEIAELTATNYVGADRGEPGDPVWVVDFEGCLKSFLSSQFAAQWEITSEEKLKYLVNIIRNFLNYLLHHDVCPEYTDQINASRGICDKAENELWAITQFNPLLPGDFNMACSEIFGGMYHGMYSENQAWMAGLDIDYQCGISPERARTVFKVALAANANDEIFQKYQKQLHDKTYHVTGVENTGFEVTEIAFPTNLTRGLYAQGQYADLKIVGKLKAKTWCSPNNEAEDLTEEEEEALTVLTPEIRYYEFWIEEELLQKCFVGMKFNATVTQLSFGVSYFDAITGVHCSFYQVLPNGMMSRWREPEKEWLPMKKKNMLAQPTKEDLEEVLNDEEANMGNDAETREKDDKKHCEDGNNRQKTGATTGDKVAGEGLNVETEAVRNIVEGFIQKPEEK